MSERTSADVSGPRKASGDFLRRLLNSRRSLSGKLILLTITVVMAAEVFVYVPSISRYRLAWLDERLAAAQIAVLALEEAPEGMVSEELTDELLRNAGVYSVKLQNEDSSSLFLSKDMPPDPEKWVDIRGMSFLGAIVDAFGTLRYGEGRNLGVRGDARFRSGSVVEIVIDETPLCADMLSYSRNILALSLVIALATAFFVYLSLMRLTVRPMQKITRSMERFRQNPADGRFIIDASMRGDEVGRTERELFEMQRDLQAALQQRARLADLGSAVSKINHDLKNILTSAQLVSDQLVRIDDPKVQRLGPKLFSAIDRAVDLCTDTLKYGKAEEAPPHFTRVKLRDVAGDVQTLLSVSGDRAPKIINDIAEETIVDADHDKLFRVLMNIVRNARDAHMASGGPVKEQYIRLATEREDGQLHILVEDNGPGIPERARENLFMPFTGSATPGGSGLGLAIARELTEVQGGTLTLLSTGDEGTCFRICLPTNIVAQNTDVGS